MKRVRLIEGFLEVFEFFGFKISIIITLLGMYIISLDIEFQVLFNPIGWILIVIGGLSFLFNIILYLIYLLLPQTFDMVNESEKIEN